MLQNLTDTDEWIAPDVPVECYKLKPIAIYLILLFIVSIVSNSTLSWIVIKYKETMSPINTLMLPLAVMNIIGTLIELPLVFISSVSCKYYFTWN